MKNNPICHQKSIQVEKIGGACMSQMDVLLQSVFTNLFSENLIRIFVVSAYSGITDLLVGEKNGTKKGVLQFFCKGKNWQQKMDIVLSKFLELNLSMKQYGLPLESTDEFITQQVKHLCESLQKMEKNLTDSQQSLTKEYLSALGEIHSAYTCHKILRSQGLNAIFVNLADPNQINLKSSLEENLKIILQKILSIKSVVPIVTGYCWTSTGIVKTHGRGYSEITFAKILQIITGSTAIIHKQFPICKIDPKFSIAKQKVEVLERTTYQSLLSLRDTEMQAIHPNALKILADCNLHLQVQSIHLQSYGKTFISHNHVEEFGKIEIISGYKDCFYIHFLEEKEAIYFLEELKIENESTLYNKRGFVLVKNTSTIREILKRYPNTSIKKSSWIVGIGSYNQVTKLHKEFLLIDKKQELPIFVTYVEKGTPFKTHLIVSIKNFNAVISYIHKYLLLSQHSPAGV